MECVAVASYRYVAVNERGLRIGQDHPRATLTDHEIELLWTLRAQGWGYKRLAAKFEVSRQCVRNILSGRNRGQSPATFRRVVLIVNPRGE